MRSVLKALPLAALGCSAALLVACGDRNGLLSGSQAGSLREALAAVQVACDEGNAGRAAIAAQSFVDRVDALPPGRVDRRLIANLRDGAATLETLVARSCRRTPTTTTATQTVTTATTPTTTTSTETTPTAPTTPTTPTTTTPTTPTTTTPTTTTPTTGGGTTTPGGGGASGDSGGAAPDQQQGAGG